MSLAVRLRRTGVLVRESMKDVVVERHSRKQDRMSARHARLPLLFSVFACFVTACNRAPSREDALVALRVNSPGLDTTIVHARVWQDGPPWFACSEVIAKFTSPVDASAVRDEVGNWKPLVLSGWVVLRDSSAGVVSDPGWCTAKLAGPSAAHAVAWVPIVGDSFPTGVLRRGWRVPVGTRRVAVSGSPSSLARDVAAVEYVTTLASNANGAAMGADRDTIFGIAFMRRVDGQWRVERTRLRAAPRPRTR